VICCGLPIPIGPYDAAPLDVTQDSPSVISLVSSITYVLGWVIVYGGGALAGAIAVIGKLCPDFSNDIKSTLNAEYRRRILAVHELYQLEGHCLKIEYESDFSFRERAYSACVRMNFRLGLIMAIVTGNSVASE
jgi:hypothetical protein